MRKRKTSRKWRREMREGKRICYLVAAMLVMWSCSTSDNNLEINITNPVNVEENAMVTCIWENLINEVEYNILMTNVGRQTKQDSVPAVKLSYSENQELSQELIIDYGTDNHSDYLGKSKRGKIHSLIKGDYCSAECSVEIEFDEFYINDMNLSGSIQIHTTGYNENDNISFEIDCQNMVFTDKNGQSYTLDGTYNKEWLMGFDTPDNPWDDQFLLSGSAYGIDSEKRHYNSEISTALLISRSCEFIAEGEVEFTVEEESCLYNFGNGLCDNKGFFIKNGEQSNFEFGRYEFRYKE